VNRRQLLINALAVPLLGAEGLDKEANVKIMEAVWENARDQFYDPKMRGVDWNAVRSEFLPKAKACSSNEELLVLLREMLSRLRNSHIFLCTDEEWESRWNILPVCFDRCDGRVFVRYVLRGRESGRLAPLEFGDEIIAVDGIPGDKLGPATMARLDEVKGNPNFGPPGSIAEVKVQRGKVRLVLEVKRARRRSDVEAVVIERPVQDILHLRFFSLGSTEIPLARLADIWNDVTRSKGFILDLRNCLGGDPVVASYISGSFLGPNKRLFRDIERGGEEHVQWTDANAPAFIGPVAVIANSNTESEPEILAAICREYGCARIFGERTAGAFNGWTRAFPLPGKFAKYALPYTRSVSPKGIEYEGHGVEPDEAISNKPSDYSAHRDRPLLAAIRYIKSTVA
jgi:C-terminal processing protease CtpA/Prc